MSRARQRGVTLIELLVAMTLFSLLSLGVFASLRTALTTLDKTRTRVAESRRVAGAQHALEQMLAGIMPVRASYVLPGSVQPESLLFFQGEPQAMRFISTHSLEGGARSTPRLIELAVVRQPDKEGVRLIVNDLPYYGPASAGSLVIGKLPDPQTNVPMHIFRPIVVAPQSFILADNLSACQFLYLDRAPPPDLDLWRPQWPATTLPRAVRVLMKPDRMVTASIHVSTLNQ